MKTNHINIKAILMALIVALGFSACATKQGDVSVLAKLQAVSARTPCEKDAASIAMNQRIPINEGYSETLVYKRETSRPGDCPKGGVCAKYVIDSGSSFTHGAESKLETARKWTGTLLDPTATVYGANQIRKGLAASASHINVKATGGKGGAGGNAYQQQGQQQQQQQQQQQGTTITTGGGCATGDCP